MVAYPLSIIQQSAPARGIILKGASLPTQGNFSIAGNQRANIDWMPGSPVAVSQVLGPTEDAIPMGGSWRDTKVAQIDSSATLINFPLLGFAAQPGGLVSGGPVFIGSLPIPQQEARTALAIGEAFNRLRQEGAIAKLEWGTFVRYGHIGPVTLTPILSTDFDWELEFLVTGLSLNQPKLNLPSITLPGLLKALLAAIQRILDAVLAAIAKAQKWINLVAAGIDRVVSLLLGLADLLRQIIDIASAPLDLLERLKSSLQSIVAAAKDVAFAASTAATASRIPSPQVTASVSGDPVELADATIDAAALRALIVEAGAEAARRSLEVDALLTSQIIAVIVTPTAMSLQKIAADVYGTPTLWARIRDFNNLNSSIVPRGTVVSVPRL